uniref:Uncharacterized protein n=1 Tax=Palpitomonas bilix TaxID=652834 RepID=A0A7S3DG01_9EUKA|mmetsp:Transcript_360/g.540  ORF Transcript_360/g.540 Transcript_360/m.540 type:complete len:348 (+) Transcript_360:174-1217(+)|eukprot:CAMPEP_0113914072 /NCGR_PEP_ID=MMETSP0780_2-20120614/30066_1 /TAXON_ID=652834 /ORGANISM="Palpitomonas bilix" /LENGTH=347 /DNA_ID=CAMNT_0000911675 /DNA_START=126 /DNA_END=1172 /DNA_ORIENTATION=+ /assembly_acc=CAM_ASM_000599
MASSDQVVQSAQAAVNIFKRLQKACRSEHSDSAMSLLIMQSIREEVARSNTSEVFSFGVDVCSNLAYIDSESHFRGATELARRTIHQCLAIEQNLHSKLEDIGLEAFLEETPPSLTLADVNTCLSSALAEGIESAHDLWFLESAFDTIRGPKSNEVSDSIRGRSRPFFMVSWNANLMKTLGDSEVHEMIQKNNTDGFLATCEALIDTASGRQRTIAEGQGYLEHCASLPRRVNLDCEGSSQGMQKCSVLWLLQLGRQVGRISKNFEDAWECKGDFQLGFNALSAVHDRYIQVRAVRAHHEKQRSTAIPSTENASRFCHLGGLYKTRKTKACFCRVVVWSSSSIILYP